MKRLIILTMALMTCPLSLPARAQHIYVDDSASGNNNGSSWTDAYNYLQDALMMALDGDEIRVAGGIYKPNEGIVGDVADERALTFQLKNGVTIKGGYAGFGEPDPNARDFLAYETILSGDIGAVADFSDNSYHIVQGGDNAILEGFTVFGGNANGSFQGGYGIGGGLYNDNCRLVVANCTFEENAALNGGAIFSSGGTLAVYESIFVANSALQGGALVNSNARMTLTRCVLSNNADGTIFCFGNGALQVESCVFDNNYGGWHAIDCSSTGNVIEVINSLFTHNAGGAINSGYNSLLIVNSTLVDNHTTTFGGGVCCSYGSLSAVNCIMWGNTAGWDGDEIFGADASMTVSYSCIAGGYPGTGNINMNPLFRAPASEDYHLRAGSPCIDAGDSSAVPPRVITDLAGEPRITGEAVDMGAYELKPSRIIYVDDTADEDNDGSSWTHAYYFLQDAFAVATSDCEIRIGQGIYKPDLGANVAAGDRAATFRLKNGATIKGGYAGHDAPAPDARDIERFKTILSGDLNRDDVEVQDPANLPLEPSRRDNSLHVVTASETNKTAVLDGVTITAGHGEYGGGMYNNGGSPTIKDCTFLENSAFAVEYSAGGGLYIEDGSPILINCRFIHNATDAAIRDHGGGDGGAIAEADSNSILIDCTFIGNVAAGNHGGAISHCGGSPELTNCTFKENSARVYGGGMCNWWGEVKLSGCTFIGNIAGSDAGGMYNCGDSSLSNCEFVGNRCRQNGGGFSSDGLNPTLTNCRFTGNFAENAGGAIANRVSSPTITNCTFIANTAGFGGGGGIYNRENANPTVSDCTFTRNRALLDYGGGGMCNNASSPVVSNCTFTQNKADDNGGAVSNWYGSSPTFTGCLFVENTAPTCGGLHSYEDCNPTVINCTFLRNSTGSFGGAMSIAVNCNATVINCLLAENSAGTHGGGLYSYSSSPTLINCTFAANSAPNGSALAFDSATNLPVNDAELVNCILWDRGGEIWIDDNSIVAISYSDIQGGWSGAGNIDTDPLFINQAGGNCRLPPNSPCINAGNNSAIPPEVTTDLDGKPRIINGTVDMGAYEYVLQPSRIIYVDAEAGGENNGSSWVDAYNFLQDALADANASETLTEIRVAAGTYQPDRGVGQTHGDRSATFQLINGVTIQGGYAGYGLPDPDARDINQYPTILSGDLIGNDAEVSDLENWEDNETRSDNSYHVVTAMQTSSTAVLDGFTVSGGYADSTSPIFYGAGMYIYQASPTVKDCVFTHNWALNYGAGMCIDSNSTPIVTDCTFTANAATDGAGADNEDSNPTFIRCTFTANAAFEFNADSYGGAGMYNYRSNPTLTNCIFAGNIAPGWGTCGALQNNQSSPNLLNCTFYGNHSEAWGSGAGGIFNGYESFPKLTNCILWGNTNEDAHDESAQISGEPATVNYCCIQGWTGDLGGLGNISADPCFVRPGYWEDDDSWVDGDYHLKSFGWRWDAAREQWVFDHVTSRCIDAGNPGSPLLDEPLTVPSDPDNDYGQNLRVNMGAYGGTAEASMPPYDWALLADINNDGIVDFHDFACAGPDWLSTAPQQPCDLDRNGTVAPPDLDLFADGWLKTTFWWE